MEVTSNVRLNVINTEINGLINIVLGTKYATILIVMKFKQYKSNVFFPMRINIRDM